MAGNRSSDDSPDRGATYINYNRANEASRTVDGRAKENNYTYDTFFPRLSAINYPATPADNVTFTYDEPSAGHYRKGRLSYVNSAVSNLAYSYDANGNVTMFGDLAPMYWSLSYYEYDVLNRLSKITYPSGRVVVYTRNSLGQITQVQQKNNATAALTTVVSNVTYEPFGPVKSLTFGNGVTTNIQREGGSRVSRLTTTSIPSWDYVYTYDLAGNITGMANQSGGPSKTFGYDGLDRILGDGNPLNPYYDISYDYDTGGNRTLFAITNWFSLPQHYAATSNQMTSFNGVATPRDGSGNLTANTTASSMVYNDANRLKQATASSVTTNYTYNGFGWRNLKNGAQIVRYDYLPDGKYLSQFRLNGVGSINRGVDYIWLDDMPVGQVITNYAANNVPGTPSLTYIHSDHLNAPVTMTNGIKVVVWEWKRDPYGVAVANDNPDGNSKTDPLDLRFPGQMYDAETKLHYNVFRYYDPMSGRYTQSDPIGLAGGLNTYLYANANPLKYIDPVGLTSLVFEPSSGVLTVDPEMKDRTPYTMPASSGVPNCGCDSSSHDKGRIPSGKYTIDTTKLSVLSSWETIKRNRPKFLGGGDWGGFNAPLTPSPTTNTFGRSGFYIHGGVLQGSAGCIDVGGGLFGNAITEQLVRDILADPNKRVPVKVLP